MYDCSRASAPFALSALMLALAISSFVEAAQAPYPQSRVITGMTWDFSTVTGLRQAHGSDLWPLTWAADGNLYGAWGDGGGFDGDSNSTGRVSLGFARITGIPSAGNAASFTGQNVWGDAPQFAQVTATFGGKIDDLVSIDGVLYGHGGLWTRANCGCTDPTHFSGDNPTQRTLTWSSDLGRTWTIAPWTVPRDLGSTLQFGQDYRGAWDPAYVYLYYQRDARVDPTRIYLRRVPRDQLTINPSTPGHYEYWVGPDSAPPSWTTVEANAVAVFHDPSVPLGTFASQSVVYDPGIGRYLLATYHGNATGQIGFFEAPYPWGPWATVAYYADWAGFNETGGEGNGLSFPTKWISTDGESLWGVFSGTGEFDSFNLARVALTVSGDIPKIIAPATGATLTPGETVVTQGAGPSLAWLVDVLGDGNGAIASGTGSSIRFLVPSNATASETIRITLTGRGGSVFRDYPVVGASSMPNVIVTHVSSGKTYPVVSAKLGTLAYIDRAYTLTALSEALAGARLIRDANEDKFQTGSNYLQFTVDRPATLYVCYSNVATARPAWLSGWSLTSETCSTSAAGSPDRVVYRRNVSAGGVTLGGNREPPAAGPGDYSNYLLIVGP